MTTRRRIESVDVVRGLIMIIMALDHTRDFFGNSRGRSHRAGEHHACAVFHLLDHPRRCPRLLSPHRHRRAFLALGKMSKAALARYLDRRGVWLIFLELVVMRFAPQFNVDIRPPSSP